MGSITKPPVAPPAPQPVYYYVPAPPPPPPPPPPAGNDGGTNTPTPTPEENKAVHEQNLLRRDRGRLGTILSGFRGILGLSDDTPTRKTLLGE